MRFSRKLITPVLAAVVLVGGAAFAQDAISDTLDGETVDLGIISWSYDSTTKTFTWGDTEGCDEEAGTEEPAADELLTEVAPDGNLHYDDNCRTVSFGESEYTAEVGAPGSDTEVSNHGQMVSGFGEELREIDKDELDGNRGSFISEIAKLFKPDEDDSDDLDEDSDDDAELESNDLEEEDSDDDSDSEEDEDSKPDKDTGKPDTAPGKPEK